MTLISIHLLQNHAPSNLNRDDNGDPKDCLFGGFRRARISSQALKRSIRWSETFRGYFDGQEELLALRTQLMPNEVRERIESLGLSDEERAAVLQQAARLGTGDSRGGEAAEGEAEPAGEGRRKGAKKGAEAGAAEQRLKSAQLMFLTVHEIDQLAARMAELVRMHGPAAFGALSSDKLIEAIGQYEPHSVDIAMFGRMTTSSPFKDIEAAVQVAHALSTHAVEQEFDFYTAVDDISGEAGAGFIGETSFNSATYYKYFSIHWENLVKNLQGDAAVAARAVRALAHAAMVAIPSGKQNSFAAHNLPDLALIEVRRQNIPLSYANAFIKPVRATAQQSLVEASAAALQKYIPQINAMYGLAADRTFLSTVPFELAEARRAAALDELLEWLPLNS
ncbi:MAG TPA: type I-E CRISPR-associated protein Cas7/Cse4/CasC [Roseiflexaceae bacterium]|nr:type I-E CRISPR-associated protein Cas7/Cse4/CasC [Roseiflexaceae bacterium]